METVADHGAENLRGNVNHPENENFADKPAPTVIQSTERVVTPIQPPMQSTTSTHSTRYNTNPNAQGKSPLVVLRTTAVQQTFGHPLNYARVLMQLGYEPLPVVRGRSLLGKDVVYYPNAFRYLQYIYRTDGFLGLYRGFGLSVLSKVISWYAATTVDELIEPVNPRGSNDDERPTLNTFIQKTLREVRCQSWGVLISHPFQVMAIRSMAQFIGGEQTYSSLNVFENIREIYVNEGVAGFFAGLIPRWLLEVSTIVISNAILHLLRTQVSLQSEVLPAYQYISALIAQSITYPLSVVSTITAVNRSGLKAASLPLTPAFDSWQDVYKYLRRTEQVKRGSSLFFRTAYGPTGFPVPGTPVPNV